MEFNCVCLCQTAKEIWTLLEVTNEGTSQVKESKISLLNHKYVVLKMDNDKTITQMYNHFNDIVVGLKGLVKIISKTGSIENCYLLCLKSGAPRSLQLKMERI